MIIIYILAGIGAISLLCTTALGVLLCIEAKEWDDGEDGTDKRD